MAFRNSIRIGVVGCGAIAERFHLPALAEQLDPHRQLVLADPNSARLAAMSAEFGAAETTEDYRELAGRVDGVVLATPPATHHAMAMYFLERGVHVLCEKPLAESLPAAEEMVNAAARHRVALAVNQTRRLFPNIAKVRELISGGVLGDLRSIIYHDGVVFDWPAASPFHFAPGSRGALSDTGIHLLDTVCWWLDAKPELVASRNDSLGGPEAVATVRMRHGECEIEVKVSRLARLRNSFRIVGTRGTIDTVAEHWDRIVIQSANGRSRSVRLRHKVDSYAALAKPLLSNFIDVIALDGSPLISGASALPAVALLEEAYETAEPYERPWNRNLEFLNVA